MNNAMRKAFILLLTMFDGGLAQINDGTNTRVYLGDMVFNKSSNGTVTLESASWEGGRLLAGSGADKTLFYVTDHVGSVRVVKDGAGNVRQRFDYYPYGTVSRVWTSSSTTDYSEKRYRFEGKEIAGSALMDLAGVGATPGAPYLDFGARLYSPRTATWLSQDPLAEKYYGLSPYLFCLGNPVKYVDPTGKSTYVKRLDDGTYEVIDGELDDDLNVYVGHYEDNEFIKDYSIGKTAFLRSFYDEDSNSWATGSIINLQDPSAQLFMESIVETRPLFLDYMYKARNNQIYDFKVSNGIEGRTDFKPYRGMLLGGAIVSARDVGNLAAGYVAGVNGVSYLGMRLMFDAYQSFTNTLNFNAKQLERNPINFNPTYILSIESLSSRQPQRLGWYAGAYNRIHLR